MDDDTGYEEHRQVKRRGERISDGATGKKALVLLGVVVLVFLLFVLAGSV